MENKEREVRAKYDDKTITVYQAYNNAIADAASEAQTFVSPFNRERMTWIKPSFLWMMYRSGWATKENQERVLAIRITRESFDWALDNACLTHYDAALYSSNESWKDLLSKTSVRIQWDPEKDIFLNPLNHRSIQIGLKGEAVEKYVTEWIVKIQDITEDCKEIHRLIKIGKTDEAKKAVSLERIYPLPESIVRKIGA